MERDAAMWWRPGGSDLVLFDVSSASDIPFDGCIVHLSANHSLSLFTPRFLCAVHPTRPSMADNHKSPLRPEGEDLLQVSYIQPFLYTLYSISHFHVRSQAALSDPFSVPNLPRVAPFQPTAPPVNTEPAPAGPSDEVLSPAATTATSPESSVSPAEFDAWQAEYSSQVAEWRRQSATVRARAEVERARWEERRAREQQQEERAGDDGQQQPQDTCTSSGEWEAVSHRSSTDAPVSVSVSTPAPAPAPLPPPPPPSQPVAPSQVNVPSSFPFPPSVVVYF